MYRKIIKAEKEDDLQIQLPEEYLNKEVEVIAFELNENTHDNADEVSDFSDAMEFFSRINKY